jgi:hypothetical protein
MNLWSYAGDGDRKNVNMFMAKPFAVYDLSSRFDLINMPYGVTVYWNKPSGQKAYVPVGGGIQYRFELLSQPFHFSTQFFYNAVRPDKGTKYDLRFMFEWLGE